MKTITLTDAEIAALTPCQIALGLTEPRQCPMSFEEELALTEERLQLEAEARELTRGLAQCRGGKQVASLLALLDSLDGGNQ